MNAPIIAPVITVGQPCKAHDRMSEFWRLDNSLWGGTRTMRAAGRRYLPQSPAEDNKTWAARMSRSFLFNAYRRTIEKMAGKVFSKEIQKIETWPGDMAKWAENVDRNGNNLDTFARAVFLDGMRKGISYILTDSPQIPPGTTLEDQRKQNIRPYMIHIPAENLIGFKSEKIGGVNTLTQIRYREFETRSADAFLDVVVERIRVIEPTNFQVWEKPPNGGNWAMVESGPMPLGRITLAAFYTGKINFMESIPPFDDLGQLNIAHWQSSSDQRQILHFARIPMLFGKGLQTKEAGDEIEWSAATMIKGPADSDLKYVEHSGAAIESGRTEIQDLENRMEVYGLELLMKQPGGAESATGRVLDAGDTNSPLQAMALALQDCLELAMQDMCEYGDLTPTEESSLKVNTDFGLAFAANAMLIELQKARAAGEISQETYWERAVYFGLLQEDFDPDLEKERLANDPLAGGGVGGMGGAPPSGGAKPAKTTPDAVKPDKKAAE